MSELSDYVRHCSDPLENKLRQRIKVLSSALAPFAEACEHLHPGLPDDGVTLDGIEVRQWSAAYAAVHPPSNGALERREDKTPPQLSEPKTNLPEETVGLGEKIATLRPLLAEYDVRFDPAKMYGADYDRSRVALLDKFGKAARLILSALPVGGKTDG